MEPRRARRTRRTASTLTIGSVAAALCALSVVSAQQTAPAPAQPVFRSGAQLVVETVTVKDKDGKVVEGLTAKDFTITEDNVAQAISFVEFQRVDNATITTAAAP